MSHLVEQLEIHFPDCWVEGYEQLIPAMNNHPKDRHVLAAAVRTGAQTIVTFDTKDFPVEALSPWNIEVQTPDEFLVHQFYLDEATVLAKLEEQAAALAVWGGCLKFTGRLRRSSHRSSADWVGNRR